MSHQQSSDSTEQGETKVAFLFYNTEEDATDVYHVPSDQVTKEEHGLLARMANDSKYYPGGDEWKQLLVKWDKFRVNKPYGAVCCSHLYYHMMVDVVEKP